MLAIKLDHAHLQPHRNPAAGAGTWITLGDAGTLALGQVCTSKPPIKPPAPPICLAAAAGKVQAQANCSRARGRGCLRGPSLRNKAGRAAPRPVSFQGQDTASTCSSRQPPDRDASEGRMLLQVCVLAAGLMACIRGPRLPSDLPSTLACRRWLSTRPSSPGTASDADRN